MLQRSAPAPEDQFVRLMTVAISVKRAADLPVLSSVQSERLRAIAKEVQAMCQWPPLSEVA